MPRRREFNDFLGDRLAPNFPLMVSALAKADSRLKGDPLFPQSARPSEGTRRASQVGRKRRHTALVARNARAAAGKRFAGKYAAL
jgi:hypothetical protein